MRLLWLLPKAASAILRHFAAYAELAILDLEAAQRDLGTRLLASVVVGVCLFFVIFSCCLIVVALTWDTHYRVAALVWMACIFSFIAVIAALYRSRVIGSQSSFLAAVRREWAEDRVIFERIFSEQD